MVEAQLEDPVLRAKTPTPRRYLKQLLRQREPNFESPGTPRGSLEFYDRSDIATSIIISEEPDNSGGDIDIAPDSMYGDAGRGDMPESSVPDHTNTGSNRRRSRSQLANAQRSSGPHTSQPSSSHGYALSSPTSSSENIHNRPPTGFQGSSLHYSSAPVPYNQRPGYVGQYTMSNQPSPMAMAHSPPPYSYSHTYHHPVVPDNSMISQSMHGNYQPMLQPPAPIFPYQRHSPEGGSSSQASFSPARSPPMYPPHQTNPSSSPTTHHLPSTSGQSNALSPSYVGSGPFQSLRYPSPMSTTPYAYPAQSFPSSPMYQSQYAPPPFGQSYTPTAETEPQGTWFYFPHPGPLSSPQQYDGPSYQGHYPPITYPQMRHSEVDGAYGAGPSSPTNPSSPTYPISPIIQPFTQYSDSHASESIRASGAGPPAQNPSAVVGATASASSGSVGRPPIVRRSYHPNPPAHRSEWVMWAGNVPSDASHDELWRFFNQVAEHQVAEGGADTTGVLSIFLISRSSCAFINYESESFLLEAIKRFNGVPLRPNDQRCAQLVCRVRRKDDDLKAGVGGQRGMGMHTRWIREQKGKEREMASNPSAVPASDDPSTSPSSVSERLAAAISTLSVSSDEGEKAGLHVKHSSSSGSYTSTNSSFLARHFPKRYFILKSLTQYDLDLSVQRGLWATQKHNEEILDQAFRTSKDVYLIFGVNKSGEFYGYARMAGPVRRGDQRVSWASRPSSQSALSRNISPSQNAGEMYFSPSDHRMVDNSPLPLTGSSKSTSEGLRVPQSAPALLGQGYHLPTLDAASTKHSLDQRMRHEMATRRDNQVEGFELDASAPLRAMRGSQGGLGTGSGDAYDKNRSAPGLHSVEEVEEKGEEHMVEGAEPGQQAEEAREEETWGECFAVEWLVTERLPFHRTRHLRNPWNHDREVKVSRDGTELEPTVGQRLLDEWERLADPQALPPVGTGKPVGKRATGLKNTAVLPAPDDVLKDEDKEGAKGGPS